ncbi:MAG: diacylglycerol/lipid kinase family protein [Phycisphaerales bacterium JB065]
MKLVIVFNPISGRGQGPRLARWLNDQLAERGDGHKIELFEVGPAAERRDLVMTLEGKPEPGYRDQRVPPADGLIVIGGDGTVHSCAKPAAQTGTPLYHFPTGTENLFAREFGMTRDIATVRAAIENLKQHELAGRQMPRIDLGRCNGRSFLLMASVGVDANIVHRLCRKRTGRISHLSYAPHILAELIRPWSKPLTITVDGYTVVDRCKGMVVVANSRQYAMRVDPARRADMSDGKLDVVFFPARHWTGSGLWMLRSRFGQHLRSKKLVYRVGETIRIESHGGAMAYQLDGEAPAAIAGDGQPATTPMMISVEHGVVPVMIPQKNVIPAPTGPVHTKTPSAALA